MPASRRRGAQPGNTNNLRHGIYSQHISVQVGEQLQSMPPDQNYDELALARTRLAECMEKQKSAPPEDWLLYERAITHYLGVISRYVNQNAVLGKDRSASFVTVLEIIRQANEASDVR
jgi:hypothetical protein